MKRARATKRVGFTAWLVLLASCALQAPDRPEPFDPAQSSPAQRARIDALRAHLAPIIAGQKSAEALLLLDLDELYRPLSAEDRVFLDEIRAQPGGDPGVAIPSGVEWVRVENQVAHGAGGDQPIPLQLVTRAVWRAFSDHNRVERLGIDFVSESGVDLEYSHAADFIALPEYRWLLANAERFGFEPDPVAAGAPVSSPWHWRHVGRRHVETR